MARVSYQDKRCAYILSNASVEISDIKLAREAINVADKRAFPVNMRTAIGTISLNDAAMIGYIRGINDAAETIKSRNNNTLTL